MMKVAAIGLNITKQVLRNIEEIQTFNRRQPFLGHWHPF